MSRWEGDRITAADRRRALRLVTHRDPARRVQAKLMLGDLRDERGNPGKPDVRELCKCERVVTDTDEHGEVRCQKCGREVKP